MSFFHKKNVTKCLGHHYAIWTSDSNFLLAQKKISGRPSFQALHTPRLNQYKRKNKSKVKINIPLYLSISFVLIFDCFFLFILIEIQVTGKLYVRSYTVKPV